MKNIIVVLLFVLSSTSTATNLASYKVDPHGITVSGVSSGAYMAVQMQVAFSNTIAGAASIAGGIYWCSQGDSVKAQVQCMGNAAAVDSAIQIAQAKKLANEGSIDSLDNLKNQKVYVFASPKDYIISDKNSKKLIEFYAALGLPSANLVFENSLVSAHGFPTLDSGVGCNEARAPWLLKCNFDTAGIILTHLYGTLNARGAADANHLQKFSQSDFGDATTPLYNEGWIYVPKVCADGETCKLHVALHGCQMNADFIQDHFVKEAGYNEWAESNRIIVLYPQSAKLGRANPYACWDWFGFTGPNYVTKSGAQMSALMKMVDRVRGLNQTLPKGN